MATRLTFTPIYEQVDAGWVQARLAELPAVITAAPSREQAREQLVDALREYLLSLGEDRPQELVSDGLQDRLEVVLDA